MNADAARRRDQERRAAERAGEAITFGPGRDDTAAVIHQEIDRLPDRYRRPVVLCYLEDMTYQQAADQLRWSEATTRGRLARARDLLRARLTRRGVTLAGTGLFVAGTASAVPAALVQATVRAARHLGLGRDRRRRGLFHDDRPDEAGGADHDDRPAQGDRRGRARHRHAGRGGHRPGRVDDRRRRRPVLAVAPDRDGWSRAPGRRGPGERRRGGDDHVPRPRAGAGR